ncbi:nuclear-interacting partner of ALK isoform X1 [Astyanax mexicanus]|uniref:Nuclear-interacting partner of ALK isoform X1 n=1 Tax=Astyanax mexicanus TaxID=7994 RepID=A0A8T2MBJ3_ASTMX|nr:nuclear-interacting partner of ALK isoform X1 [Astyanax mexicanus]
MAAVENAPDYQSENSTEISPLKIRQLLREGFASEDDVLNRSALLSNSLPCSFVSDVSSEATNQDAFFDRVESYSCLKWTGKPSSLSPLRCAQYGWINVDCDILKCSSCQAFLCASIQPTLDFQKYEGRILELTKQLQTQHEKFCTWPDFPCPERFCMVPVDEPEKLLGSFTQRFQNACRLHQQLPTVKPEQLTSMSPTIYNCGVDNPVGFCSSTKKTGGSSNLGLTEDVVSSLLQLIDDEQKLWNDSSDSPNIQMAACVVALCGWEASSGPVAVNLPMLNCTFCMRKVGLWNFQQLEAASSVGDNSSYSQCTTLFPEGRVGERPTTTSPPQSPTPCRMKLRSQDNSRTEQSENTSSLPRTRSRDSPSPNEEVARGKRPLTRSRGHGDNLMADMPSSPQRKTKRPCLSSSSGLEGPLQRNLFDPVAQHRNWCPWVNISCEQLGLDRFRTVGCEMEHLQSGWKATLGLLLTKEKSISPGPVDKSKRVLAIFQK